MEENPPTSSQNQPSRRDPGTPLRSYARAIASESRRFYHGMTRENIASFLKTMAWAAPLTILIWVYAESEQQVTDSNQPITIQITSRDPNKVVTLNRGVQSIECDLSGPRSNLDRFKGTLSPSNPITIELDTRQMGDREYIPTLDNLRENPRFRDAGITIDKCDPASLPITIDTVEKRTLPVKAPTNIPVKSVSFDPPAVAVTGPRRVVEAMTEVTADLSSVTALNKPGVPSVYTVPLQSDSTDIKMDPGQVKATLTVADTDVHGTIHVPIWLEILPQTAAKYDVTPNGSGFSPELDVVGPPDQIAKLESKEIVPRALLEISDANVTNTGPVPLKIQLPEGVHLAGPPPEITFTATARQ